MSNTNKSSSRGSLGVSTTEETTPNEHNTLSLAHPQQEPNGNALLLFGVATSSGKLHNHLLTCFHLGRAYLSWGDHGILFDIC